MTDKEKILQEIERLQKPTMDENHNFTSDYNQGLYDGLSQLELFIDSLPEEPKVFISPPAESDEPWNNRTKTNVGEAMEELEEKIALYEKNHSATDTLANSLEISRHGNSHNGGNGDLEEAASQYPSIICHISPQWTSEVENVFKAGAEWQKEQMMKEAVETTVCSMVHQLIVTDYIIINAEQFGLKKGDKVKVLIIKEDKI